MKSRVTTGHLCCGGGGDILGAVSAGATPTWAIDIEGAAISTVIANHGLNIHAVVGNICGLALCALDPVDMIICGIPCQPFTRIGRRRLEKDSRDVSLSVSKIITNLHPRYVIFENVREYRSSAGYEALNASLEGYLVKWDVINFADYGLPQRRLRLIGLGSRDTEVIFPEPTHTERAILSTNAEWLKFRTIINGDGMKPLSAVEIRGVLRRLANHSKKGNGFSVQVIGRDDMMVTVMGTMYRGSGTSSHANLVWDAGMIRNVSFVEARRAQGFPDEYSFMGTLKQRWQMVANAIPPPIAEKLIRALARRELSTED